MIIYLVFFAAIFAINLLPVFAPPTWAALPFFVFNLGLSNMPVVAATAAFAASVSALLLALVTVKFVRPRLSAGSRGNLEELANFLRGRFWLAPGIFFLWALSPLSAGLLWIAYGLLGLGPRAALLSFFAGRFLGYWGWSYAVSQAAWQSAGDLFSSAGFISVSFIVSQVIALMFFGLFVKLDWRALLQERRLQFVGRQTLAGLMKQQEEKVLH